jgi:hypothetical protein
MRLFCIALAAVVLAAPALAQQHDHAAPACTAMDAALPAGLEDWNGGAVLPTLRNAKDASDLRLTPGKGYLASLAPTSSVVMAVAPEKPGGSVSYSGLFHFNIETAGNYAVALSTAAWIDVVEDGKAVEPLSFGHGPACTTIRKMVVYPLKAGQHVLQIAGNGAETAKLMVAKQP